jgi:isoquinoline 1-oxidoreductase subunit alpha
MECAMKLEINGNPHDIAAQPEMPLLWALRDLLGLTGTKYGCGAALCGACTVHVDGKPERACTLPLRAVADKKIVTIEGIGLTVIGKRVAAAWIAEDVAQCGYCQSGQIMSAVSLLASNPSPNDDEINVAMNGNLCRCGAYDRIRKAIHRAAAG